MFPVLFEIPNAWEDLPGEILVVEIVIGVACLLAWLGLHFSGRRDWLAATLNTGAVIVALHLLLSNFMGDTPITIYSFGVVIIIGFLAACWYAMKQTDRLRIDSKKIFDWGFWLLVIGIIGARLLYAFLNYEQFENNKLEVLRIWHGGLVWYGGLIPATILGVWLLTRYKLPVLQCTDIASVAIILGLGLGRWACLLAGDDYGKPTDSWLGIRFYHERCLVPQALRGELLHPTQLYMSVNCLWLFFVLEWIRRRARFAGQAFAWMLILYAVSRAVFIEPFRGDFVERNPGWGKHAAFLIVIDLEDGSPPVKLERGAKVRTKDGREGQLLEDLELPGDKGYGTAWGISNEPDDAAEWSLQAVEGLPEGVEARAEQPRPYGSDLPQPPGYVSTSQTISIFIVVAGVLLLLFCRKLDVPGYAEAVKQTQTEADARP